MLQAHYKIFLIKNFLKKLPFSFFFYLPAIATSHENLINHCHMLHDVHLLDTKNKTSNYSYFFTLRS